MNKQSTTSQPVTDSATADYDEDTQETVQSLELAIAQIGMSLQESEDSVGILISAITAMSHCVKNIEGEFTAPDKPQSEITRPVHKECRKAETAMQQAITAFQFYDRLSQRFLHIQENLRAVANVIRAPGKQHHSLWQELHEKTGSLYSLEQEQRMYQALLDGLPAEDVKLHPVVTLQTNNDIELF